MMQGSQDKSTGIIAPVPPPTRSLTNATSMLQPQEQQTGTRPYVQKKDKPTSENNRIFFNTQQTDKKNGRWTLDEKDKFIEGKFSISTFF